MKQKLLLIILPLLFFAATIQAQTKVWDFGKTVANGGLWEVNAGTGTNIVFDNLGLLPHRTKTTFGQIDANNASWTGVPGEADYSANQRLKFNGKGADLGVYMPTDGSLYFPVTGDVTIKIWFRLSGTETPNSRTLYITDGTNLIGSYLSVGDTGPLFLKVDYVGGPNTLYIYGAGNSFNIYKIEVSPDSSIGTTATLGTADYKASIFTNLKAIGNRIYLSDVKSNTEVNIYSITGALVKSFKTNEDTNFSFKSGLWIAIVKTVEGQKSFKLLTH